MGNHKNDKYVRYFQSLCLFIKSIFNYSASAYIKYEQSQYIPDIALIKVYLGKHSEEHLYIAKYTELKPNSPLREKYILHNGKRKFYLSSNDTPESILYKLYRFSANKSFIYSYLEQLEKSYEIKTFSPKIFYDNLNNFLKNVIQFDYPIHSIDVIRTFRYEGKGFIVEINPKEEFVNGKLQVYPTITVFNKYDYPDVSLNGNFNILYSDIIVENIDKFKLFLGYIKEYMSIIYNGNFKFCECSYKAD